MARVKWSRAVHHLTELAESCARLADSPIHPLRVTGLWVAGEILGPPADLDTITVALVVDLPSVPWLTTPPGAQHWAAASRLARGPFTAYWRTDPVWNHRIHRPALVWDGQTREDVLTALAEGRGEDVRLPAPTPGELAARVAEETAVSLAALRDRSAHYAEHRWRPGKIEPRADALWEAGAGYLDLLETAEARK
ncbi:MULTISPECIES: DUF7711 family protein [Actinokineospora]|uniref:DUF7711 domain-containing protein n=1 Tax=Actinokineospora fastidiosa TaxID=1816 RepID=A0A918GF08_9PSEU|nr:MULTISPECIES: hypothetical protein [Actinokineospora]UVS80190.1 hypothetical protein Actkin_03940 [Actinokineospora sp. UTMC 2448]GGS33603.1 hypothetical protein GCM10010171_29820 [Actinokineospora fastidiosa]